MNHQVSMLAIQRLVTAPRSFFERRTGERSLLFPVLVVLANAIILFVLVLALVPVISRLDGELSSAVLVYAVAGQTLRAPQELALAVVLPFLMFLGGWVLLAGIVYGVSRYFGGEGSFRRLLAFLGWGFLPGIVPTVAKALVVGAVALTVPDLASENATRAWLRSTLLDSVWLRIVAFATPFFTVWSAYLWVLGAQYGRDLTRRQALVAVALPAAFTIVNDFGPYVQFFL